MAAIDIAINNLIQTTRELDPGLADVLTLIADEVSRVASIVDPAPVVQKKVAKTIFEPPVNISIFTASFTANNVILTWEAPQVGNLLYELRVGATWDAATRLLNTANLSAVLDPILIGTTTYLIKAINNNGIYSKIAASVDVVVPAIGNFTITPYQVNNFVNLDWDEPTSTFTIDHYIITKDTVIIAAFVRSSFYSLQETTAGIYDYGVTAVDIAGNESSEIIVTLDVNGPTDFDFTASLTSSFAGTIVNGRVEYSRLLVCIDLTKTWTTHFSSQGWTSPQDQIDAGYPIYIQPTLTTASYEEIFDFGAIFQNVIVGLSWLFETIFGAFTFGISVKVSDDNVTYSTAYTSPTNFVTSVRYVKVKLTFTGGNDKALLAFSNFVCTLNVKREVDGGEQDIFAADGSGTVVLFNKTFKFVESITVTSLNTSIAVITTYNFTGGVNPTQFLVFARNVAGTRIDTHISWKARGVV